MQSFDWSNQILSVVICQAYIMLKNDLIMQFLTFHYIMLDEPHLLMSYYHLLISDPGSFFIRGNEPGYETTHTCQPTYLSWCWDNISTLQSATYYPLNIHTNTTYVNIDISFLLDITIIECIQQLLGARLSDV